jgi:hypothetical protein
LERRVEWDPRRQPSGGGEYARITMIFGLTILSILIQIKSQMGFAEF